MSARCYPGIGLSCWEDRDVFGVIRMIRATQAAKTGGFTVFDYDPPAAADIVPLLGLGITRKD